MERRDPCRRCHRWWLRLEGRDVAIALCHRAADHRGALVRTTVLRPERQGPVVSKPIIRCAIYTRKSSDAGLDQDFNALDARHEACAAYIASQHHEGWKTPPRPLRRWRPLGRHAGAPGAAASAPGHRCRPGRHGRCLQDRPAEPLACRLRQAGGSARGGQLLLRLRHAGLQHVLVHRPPDAQRAALLRPVRARGHRRADPGQDRRLEEQGAPDGRSAPLGHDPHPDPNRREPVVNGAEAETVRRLFGFHLDHGCLNATANAARKAGL